MVAVQLAQWAGPPGRYISDPISKVNGLVACDALGSIFLTLLAPGVFISGLA